MNEYVGLTTLKAQMPGNGITTTEYDDELMQLNEAVCRKVDDACATHFYTITQTRYPIGSGCTDIWLDYRDWLVSLNELKYDSTGDGSFAMTLVEGTDFHLYPYGGYPKIRLEIPPRGSQITAWPTARRALRAVGKWGWSEDTIRGGTLGSAIVDTTGTSVTMAGGHSVERGHTVLIDSEQIYVVAVNVNTLTVIRGVNGTTAATHLNSAPVLIRAFPPQVAMAVIFQVNRIWKRRESAFANVLNSTDLGLVQMFRGLDPDVEGFLAAFTKPVVA